MSKSVASPASIANSGSLILVAIFIAVVIWKGQSVALWKAVADSGGFVKWFAAAWFVRVVTQFKSVQPVGGAIWTLTILAFFYQVALKAQDKRQRSIRPATIAGL